MLITISSPAEAGSLPTPAAVSFSGDIVASRDISAISGHNGMLVIGADEARHNGENVIQWLKKTGSSNYSTVSSFTIHRGDNSTGREIDIEAIALDAQNIYVIGSHSLARKRLDPDASYEKNRKRIASIKREASRNSLIRLHLDGAGNIVKQDRISLLPIIESDPVLAPFTRIPGKENGIDIEGLAARDGLLYAGFRAPVLRDGYLPVLQFDFDNAATTARTLYVNLGGRGIRDMATVSDGFLLLAGPVGDEPVSFQLLHWNGRDLLPGKDRNGAGRITLIGELAVPDGGKAEGMALLQETDQDYELIIVFDGLDNGAPQQFTIGKP
ncbi:DUF3616 domain-containing protein [Mariprofundus ferrinatatus]|uniref:DUF3616 domain-containing protein n=1 Tax=Mariprofundus ferrinatatus TaxID=1921087 RepID=UPI0018E27CDC|nr:DUF3616 domain-containing protein [Mariprofundus ferrinatatus]